MVETLTPVIFHIGKYILASAILLVFYLLVIKKHASFNESRLFLLSIAIISVFVSQFKIEVTHPDPIIVEVNEPSQQQPSQQLLLQYTNAIKANGAINNQEVSAAIEKQDKWIFFQKISVIVKANPLTVLLSIYILVLLIIVLNLSIQYLRIRRLKNKGSVSFINGQCVVEHDEISTPFSFAKTIYLPATLNNNQREIIIEHESGHISHKHYIDVLLQEIYLAIFWFNPIQWIIGKELRGVHEYQADRTVLDQGFELFRYQTIILEEVIGNHYRLANGFNQSFTKKRFIQMKHSEHLKLSRLRKVLSLPFILVLFAALSFQPGKSQVVKINTKVTAPVNNNGQLQTETIEKTSTYSNGTLLTEDVITKSEDNISSYRSSIDRTQSLSDLQAAYVKSIDSILQMVDQALPIVKKLAKSKEPSKDIENMEALMASLSGEMDEESIRYMDLSEETRNSFTQSDFVQLEEILKSMKDKLTELRGKKIDSADSPYLEQPEQLCDELVSTSDFYKKLMPEILNIMGRFMGQLMQGMIGGFTGTVKSNGDMDESNLDSDEIGSMGGAIGDVFGQLGQAMGQLYTTASSYEATTPAQTKVTPSAVSSVTLTDNQAELTRIARSSNYTESVRIEAVNKITNEVFLFDIIKFHSIPESVQMAVVNKISSEALLFDIAKSESYTLNIRISAINKIYNQALLSDIAKNQEGEITAKLSAVKRITNQEMLSDIACSEKIHQTIRMTAISRITNYDVLKKVKKHVKEPTIKETINERMKSFPKYWH